jgi:methyl-accepting chemotaxis protein
MDYYNYLQENDAFQQIKDSAEQQRDAIEDIKQRYIESGEMTLLPAFDLLSKGIKGVSKVVSTISDISDKVSGAVEKVSGAVEKVAGAPQTVETSVNENLNNISGRLSDRLRTSAFDADPEEGLASNEMNVSNFERVQQIFRGGNLAEQAGEQAEGVVSRVSGLAEQAEGVVSGLGSRVSGAVSGLAEQAETTVSGLASRAMGAVEEGVSQLGEKSVGEIASKVGSTVAEGVGEAVGEGIGVLASEAIPVVGELAAVGLGIYDLFKGITQKVPQIQAEAVPSFISGL